MTRGIGLALLTASAIVGASMIGSATHGVAQEGTIKLAEMQKGRPAPRVAPRPAAPRPAAPRPAAPRTFSAPGGQRNFTGPRTATPRNFTAPSGPRNFTGPRPATPRTFPGSRTTEQRTVTQQRTFTQQQRTFTGQRQAIAPRQFSIPRGATPRRFTGPGFRAIGARSSGRIILGGRNYTVWRGGHRVRWGGRWVALGAIGALGVIAYSGANYYPYAYVSAVGPACEGLTEDGCVMQWQEVPTEEGFAVSQCVAYCPWQ